MAAKKTAAKKTAAKKTAAKTTAAKTTATKKTTAKKTAAKAPPATTPVAKAKKASPGPAIPIAVTTSSEPKSRITSRTIPHEKPYTQLFFTRAGCFALASPSRVAWANPHINRVGWLNLDDGSFQDFFSRKYARCIGVDGDTLVATVKDEFVVIDPARGKKPVRYPSFVEDLDDIAFSPTSVLTVQPEQKSRQAAVHIWDRASFKLLKVLKSSRGWPGALSPSSAAIVVGDTGVVELWTSPWAQARTVNTGFSGYQPVKGLGFSSDGARLAVASVKEVVIIDVASATVVQRLPAAAKGSAIKTPLRADHTSKTWLRPLPHDQLLIIDFASGVQFQEVVVELWNIGSKERVTAEVVTLRAGKGQGLAEQIAVSDDAIVLNRYRMLQLS